MRQTLRILRKDVRHLWPRIAVVVFLAAVYAYIEAIFPRNPMLMFAEGGCGLLLMLAAWFVVVSVIHEDRLTGNNQFWITRPYSWRSLLLAKALFILLFLNLPVLLAQIAGLAGAGLSPAHYLPKLLWRQLGFAAMSLAPVAALAAVTANLVQFAMTFLAIFAGLYALFLGMAVTVGTDALAWGSAGPVVVACQSAITSLFGVSICVLQYSRRATTAARWLVACGVVAPWIFATLVPWGAAFAVLAKRSPAVDPTAVRLSLDPARDRNAWPGGSVVRPHQDVVGISLPIHVTGIPAGMETFSERVAVTVETPGGETWSSGWDSLNAIRRSTQVSFLSKQILPGAGSPWLEANIDRSFFNKFSTTPVHLRITVAFTLLGKPTTTRLTVSNRRQPLPDDGFCYLQSNTGFPSPLCFAALRKAAEYMVRLQPLETGDVQEYESVESLQPTGTLNVFSIWERLSSGVGYKPPPSPYAVFFETRQAVAHFERVLDLQAVRLGEM
ncbi:MAG: hypothetical protein ABSB88_03420 [Bryobacteraceae bacterium]|jgi:hypothetical protein